MVHQNHEEEKNASAFFDFRKAIMPEEEKNSSEFFDCMTRRISGSVEDLMLFS